MVDSDGSEPREVDDDDDENEGITLHHQPVSITYSSKRRTKLRGTLRMPSPPRRREVMDAWRAGVGSRERANEREEGREARLTMGEELEDVLAIEEKSRQDDETQVPEWNQMNNKTQPIITDGEAQWLAGEKEAGEKKVEEGETGAKEADEERQLVFSEEGGGIDKTQPLLNVDSARIDSGVNARSSDEEESSELEEQVVAERSESEKKDDGSEDESEDESKEESENESENESEDKSEQEPRATSGMMSEGMGKDDDDGMEVDDGNMTNIKAGEKKIRRDEDESSEDEGNNSSDESTSSDSEPNVREEDEENGSGNGSGDNCNELLNHKREKVGVGRYPSNRLRDEKANGNHESLRATRNNTSQALSDANKSDKESEEYQLDETSEEEILNVVTSTPSEPKTASSMKRVNGAKEIKSNDESRPMRIPTSKKPGSRRGGAKALPVARKPSQRRTRSETKYA